MGRPLNRSPRTAAAPGLPPDDPPPPLDRWARWALWALLAASWPVMVGYMWDALTTVPDAARLEETRMAVIPTSRTFFAAVFFSALELAVVLGLLWPRWRPAYAARLAGTTLALSTWFVLTIPMGVSRMDWVHRRWLFFLILATALALPITLAYRSARWLAQRA